MRRAKLVHPISQEAIDVTAELQRNCMETYLTVVSSLETGISEMEIAERAKSELIKRGYTDYWYTIPILVLIGSKRFIQMASSDYNAKHPSKDVLLKEGDVIFIDMHPLCKPSKRWGNFAGSGIFLPGGDSEQIDFLNEMQTIQLEGIKNLKPEMTAREVILFFQDRFLESGIELVDVRFNVGHAMQRGPKRWTRRSYFLDENNGRPIGNRIIGIEPGGKRKRRLGNGIVVARFELCVYVSEAGIPVILGEVGRLPVVFPATYSGTSSF